MAQTIVILVGCKASDRVLIETRNVTAGGHTIQISTKACSAEAVASRPLAKRQVENACEFGGSDLRCGTGGTAPLAADCTALESALPAALAAEGNPTLFEVAPQTAEEFSLGTCLWAWANNNPAGGATLEFCFSDLVQFGKDLDKDCIAAGATVGLVQPNSATLPASELAWFQEFGSPFLMNTHQLRSLEYWVVVGLLVTILFVIGCLFLCELCFNAQTKHALG
ncbi:hypothetical protein C8F04DRAFT_1181427 [Mycena alexandri]|uniref:Uncharacterized protein n=1 Tax=Mycena alexandri TaxID=1745969 RepID=A0AAD6T0C2_9AGAR|nr:hypothetical protein C8F04DRAFT_1181427 [Mycena alexandri]